MTAAPLSNRALNRAALARQLLLARQDGPVDDAVHRVGGVQGQGPMWPFVGLWSRLVSFERTALLDALFDRSVVKATMMRGTLHLLATSDYVAVYPGMWPFFQTYAERYRPSRATVENLAEVAAAALEFAATPRPATEIRSHLALLRPGIDPSDLWWRVRFHSPLLHAPVASAAWGFGPRNHAVDGRAWLGVELDGGDAAVSAGVQTLLQMHLRAFGPATAADVTRWSGLPVGTVRAAISALEPELVPYRDEAGRELLDVPGAPMPDPDTPAPVRLLAMWDSLLLAYTDCSRVITASRRRAVVNNRGDVAPTFLVDGFVAGTWAVQARKRDAVLRLRPFDPLANAARTEVVEEAERLVEFCAPDATTWRVEFESS